MSRAVHLSLALSVASLALPRAGDRWICRYTGEAMSPCPCPASSDEPAGPAMSGSGCCEFQRGGAEGVAVVSTAAAFVVERLDLPLPPALLPELTARAPVAERIAARQQGPPGKPRFISHRALLI